jgi:hypothetical protein
MCDYSLTVADVIIPLCRVVFCLAAQSGYGRLRGQERLDGRTPMQARANSLAWTWVPCKEEISSSMPSLQP